MPNDEDPRKWFATRLKQSFFVTAFAIVSNIATGAMLHSIAWFLTATPAGFFWARFFPEHFSFLRPLRQDLKRHGFVATVAGFTMIVEPTVFVLFRAQSFVAAHAVAFAIMVLGSAVFWALWFFDDDDYSRRAKRAGVATIADLVAKVTSVHGTGTARPQPWTPKSATNS